MKDDRMRTFWMSLILTVACVLIATTAGTALYRVHLRSIRSMLRVLAHSEADLIGAVVRYDRRTASMLPGEHAGHDPLQTILSQIVDAHQMCSGFGHTGEVSLGYARGDTIFILTVQETRSHGVREISVPRGSAAAEIMNRALAGLSGTMTGKDYRWQSVIAAYEPIPDISMGIVAKIDIAEVRWPYIRAAGLAALVAAFVVVVGIMLIRRESLSIVHRLQDRKRLLDRIIATIPYSVFWKDKDCNFLGCNPHFAHEAGLQNPDEIVGKNDFELSWKENAELYRADDRAVMESGVSKLRYVEPQVRSDGSEYWLETSKVPLHNHDGRIAGVLGIYADITDQKLMEQAAQERDAIFRAITESARDAIIAINAEGRVSVFNAAAEQLFGVTASDVLGGDLGAIVPDSMRSLHQRKIEQFLTSGQSTGAIGRILELQGKRRDGTEFPVEIALSACDNVPSLRVVAIVRDITERKQFERFQHVLSKISAASNLHATMSDLLQYCHRQIAQVINAANFYVALYHRDTDQYSFPYAVDHYTKIEEIPIARMDKSFAEYVRRTGKPLLADEAARARLAESGEVDLIGECARVWMGMPLETPDGVIGVMAMQSYDDEHAYGERELALARGIAERIAPAVARMQAEVALGESEAKYRLLVENQSDLVIRMGLSGSFLYVSPSYCELFGKSENELLGNAFLPHVHPEDRTLTAISLKDLLRPPHSCSVEHRMRTTYGWRWIAWSHKAVLNDQGKATATVGVGRDITERRAAEETYRRLATAVQQASDAIVITNRDGIIEYVNPAFERTSGYARDEAVGQSPRIVKSGSQDSAFYEALWSTISSGLVWKGRLVNRRKDGSLYQEVAIISPVRDEQGNIINYVAVKRDITQEVELERQLSQAQKLEAVGSLAAGIAHEINTPIQFVGDNVRFLSDSFADLLELAQSASAIGDILTSGSQSAEALRALQAALDRADVGYLQDEIPKAIEQTLDGVDRVATIVRAMKDFSHPEQMDKSSTDLNRALQSTLIVARNELKYVADVATDFDETLPPILCYPSDLNQVFLNLLVNAAHAIADVVGTDGSERGTITVSTRRDGENVVVAISDTGTGIPENARDRIFEHFFTTKDVGKGTGQGLSIARSVVVEKHGGELTFETEMKKGTTFYIRLPIGEEILETVT